jgi:hypothetical protein
MFSVHIILEKNCLFSVSTKMARYDPDLADSSLLGFLDLDPDL